LGVESSGGRGNLTGDDHGTGFGDASLLLQARGFLALGLDARGLQVRSFLASSLAALFRSERGDALFQGTASGGSSIVVGHGVEVVWRRG
jgi:hypothetical protein